MGGQLLGTAILDVRPAAQDKAAHGREGRAKSPLAGMSRAIAAATGGATASAAAAAAALSFSVRAFAHLPTSSSAAL